MILGYGGSVYSCWQTWCFQSALQKIFCLQRKKNVGYILKSNCTITSGSVLKFTRFNGSTIESNSYIPLNYSHISGLPYSVDLLPHYEFSYFVETSGKLELYNLFDSTFGIQKFSSSQFK